MKPERQFWGWVAILCAGLFALVGLHAWLFDRIHNTLVATLPLAARRDLLLFLGLAVLSLLPFLVLGMRVWYRRYVLPLHRLTEDVEALVYGSPRARVRVDLDDPAGLAPLLNALMERYQHGEEVVEARLGSVQGELARERSRTESLLESIEVGVLLCGAEGQIVSVNRAARESGGALAGLGVGRAASDLLGAQGWTFAQETLQAQLATGVSRPEVRFAQSDTAVDAPQIRMVPLLVLGGRLDGYALFVTPIKVTERAAARTTPHETLQDWRERRLTALRYLVFDIEATGLRPAHGDAVVALGAVVVAGGRIVGEESLDELVNPGRPSSPAAQRVHGIPSEALVGKPPLREVLPAFVALAQGSVLVAHNAAFDMAFLRPAAEQAGLSLGQPVLDTMLLSAALHPGQPSHGLDSLLERYGITPDRRHSALGDARMTAELLLRLLPLLEQRGIVTLGDALDASRRTYLARLRYDG